MDGGMDDMHYRLVFTIVTWCKYRNKQIFWRQIALYFAKSVQLLKCTFKQLLNLTALIIMGNVNWLCLVFLCLIYFSAKNHFRHRRKFASKTV